MNNKKLCLTVLVLIILWTLGPRPAAACSAFIMAKDGSLYFGRNFDYFTGAGLLTVNPRNVAKTALVYPGIAPAQWTALYGSLSFNQIGRDFPMGGMNEKGLVVECLWLPQTQYPIPDARPALTELQWIQYMLDTCQTVADVLDADSRVRIFPSTTKLHFLLLDRTGAAAVVEFQAGRSVLFGPDRVPVMALTNTSYADDVEFLKQFRGFGGQAAITPSWRSDPERFAVLAGALGKIKAGTSGAGIREAFDLLDAVDYDGPDASTQWRIVYDPLRLEVHFQTKNNMARRFLKFKDFSFDCGAEMKTYDLAGREADDVGKAFVRSSLELNVEFTRKTFETYWQAGFSKEMDPFVVALIGRHPGTNHCR